MEICNCHQDLDKLLCDIPQEWRVGIVKSICLIFQKYDIGCEDIKKCQTLTTLSPFILSGSILSITYKAENGVSRTRSIDLEPIIESALEDVDPKCLASAEAWAAMTVKERINALINKNCECC